MKVLVLDGYNLIYRAKHSGFARKRDVQDLEDRSIVYMFMRSLRALFNEHKPQRAYFVLEGSPKRRIELTESFQPAGDYKAGRGSDPDPGFTEQKKIIIYMMKYIWPGVTVVRHPDHECDDVAHKIAQDHAQQEDDVLIISSDTDFLQSINNRVTVWNPIKKSSVHPIVTPEQYAEWKALRGDSTDNVEGFFRVGDVTAKKLVENRDKLEEFLEKEEGNRAKFEHNLEMIKFESVDLSTAEYVSTFNNSETRVAFRNFLSSLGYDRITGTEKSWNRFIEPILDMEIT